MSFPLIALGDAVIFKGGGTPSRSDPEYWNGNIPWATVKDLNDGSKLRATQEFITDAGLRRSASNLIPAGTIIIPTRMALGKAVIADIAVAINQDLKAVFPSKEIDPRYLLQYFIANAARIESLGKGATVKGVTLDQLRKLSFPLAPLAEQRRIAAILDKADALRTKRREAIAKLDQLLQSVFLEMFGDPVTNPMGWPLISFTEVGEWKSGATPSKNDPAFWDGSFPWVSPKDMKVDMISDAQDHVSELALKKTNLKRIQPGHLLIVVRGMILAHSFPTAINAVPVAINQDMKAIQLSDNVDVVYLKAAIDALKVRILSVVSTAGHGTRRLDTRDASEVLIPLPPTEMQRKFGDVVKAVSRVAMDAASQSDKSDRLFASIQEKAFSGTL